MKGTRKLRLYVLATLLFPAMAHAADAVSIIEKVVQYIQGPFVAAAGVLAIAVCGILCFKGMFPKMYFMMVMIGIGIILGASYYYRYTVT